MSFGGNIDLSKDTLKGHLLQDRLGWGRSALISFRRDMIYALAWSSVGALGEASASAALIADESVFSTCLFTAVDIEKHA